MIEAESQRDINPNRKGKTQNLVIIKDPKRSHVCL